jgi:hypothetical protein
MASLIFQDNVPASYRTAFVAKVIQVAANLGINPNWLMIIIYFESARSFSPSKFSATKNYVGLIQFGHVAAKDLGTSVAKLSKMTAVQQLDYVEKYYKMWFRYLRISIPNSFVDFYLVTLFPIKVNKGHDAVIESKAIPGVAFAKANRAFKPNASGKITVGEVNRVLMTKIPLDWINSIV